MFRFECDTGNGGYGFTGTESDILDEVDREYGPALLAKVKAWIASNSWEFHTGSLTIYRL